MLRDLEMYVSIVLTVLLARMILALNRVERPRKCCLL